MWRRQQRKNRSFSSITSGNPVNPRRHQGFWNDSSSLEHHMYLEHKAVHWHTEDAVAWCPRGSSFSEPVIYIKTYKKRRMGHSD